MNHIKYFVYCLLVLALLSLAACGTMDVQVEGPINELQAPTEESSDTAVEPMEGPLETAAAPAEETTEPEAANESVQPPEQPTQMAGLSVAGWLGHVVGLPHGSQYDDFLILSPAGTGEFGLAGATPEIETQIIALRDKEEPGKYAHFWGTLYCDVPDYNGCQLRVERIRAGATATDPEPVDGWQGMIRGATFNSGISKVFELAGKFPMQFSIDSLDESLRAQLEELRDTGALVKVWGELLTGIPDVNGSRIHVARLQVLQPGQQAQPTRSETIDVTEGWQVFINERYNYEFRYPEQAVISLSGPQSFASDELPEGMTPDQYIDQLTKSYTDKLCVMIEVPLGFIAISAPPNHGYKYTICGRSGAGAGEMTNKIESMEINGQTYPSQGFELMAGGETLDLHNETLSVELPDGTVIQYGARPDASATYADYLMKTKEVLKQILASYRTR
jgi:hypothetical protein